MLKFFKLARSLRLLRLSTLWQFLQRVKFTAVFRLVRLFFLFCFVAHWIACLWFAIPQFESGVDYTDAGAIALTSNWITASGWAQGTQGQLYVVSLYWAFTTLATVGYGDVHPVTTAEQVSVAALQCCKLVAVCPIRGGDEKIRNCRVTYTSTDRRRELEIEIDR